MDRPVRFATGPHECSPAWRPFWDKLAFAVTPGGQGGTLDGEDGSPCHVTGVRGSRDSSGLWTPSTRFGWGIESTANTAGGAYWAMTDHFVRTMRGSIAFTIVILADVTSMATWGKAVCIPVANGTWSDPWHVLAFGRESSASTAAFLEYSITNSATGNPRPSDSGSGFWETSGGFICYSGSRDYSNNGIFYKDGKHFATVAFSAGNAGDSHSGDGSGESFVNRQAIEIFNNSHSSSSEGMTGISPAAYIWGKLLYTQEHVALSDDIYGFLRYNTTSIFFMGKAPAAAAGNIVPLVLSQDHFSGGIAINN